MRKKVFDVLNRIYGVLMFVSFFAGFLPIIPFIVAIIVGGSVGEAISVFIYKQYYPWVIIIGSIAIIFGLIAMYVGKLQGLTVKKVTTETENEK